MTWPVITLPELYERCLTSWVGQGAKYAAACAWIEAEGVLEVRALVDRWYHYLEEGTADLRQPDPLWEASPGKRALTPELADALILEMDADFDEELVRTRKPYGAEFSRLSPPARLAFAQELYPLLKTSEEIVEEARQRVEKGELIPPPQAGSHDP